MNSSDSEDEVRNCHDSDKENSVPGPKKVSIRQPKPKGKKQFVEEDTTAEKTTKIEDSSTAKSKIKWTKDINAATKKLISLREEYTESFESPKTTKAAVWRKIARKMVDLGYEVNGDICKKKWDNLSATYKTHNDASNKTGEGSVNWDLFEIMHKVVGRKGSINPDPAQLMGSLGIKQKSKLSAIQEEEALPPKRKRSEPEWIGQYRDSRQNEMQQQFQDYKKLEEERFARQEKIEMDKIAAFKEVENKKLELLQNLLEHLRK